MLITCLKVKVFVLSQNWLLISAKKLIILTRSKYIHSLFLLNGTKTIIGNNENIDDKSPAVYLLVSAEVMAMSGGALKGRLVGRGWAVSVSGFLSQ